MAFPVDERFVAEAESKLGIRFPAAYRARLLRANGGVVAMADEGWFLHPVRDDSEPRRLRRTWDDVVRQTELARAWSGFPPSAVSIAGNGEGDHLVLMPKAAADQQIRVAIWDHETGDVAWIAEGTGRLFDGS